MKHFFFYRNFCSCLNG